MKKQGIQSMIFIALFATLMCVGAWIHFPSAVPATMQTFVVMTALGLIGSKNTFIMLLVYVFLGIIGLPVFSGFTSGIGALSGPTAGFIWGFLLGVPVFYISQKFINVRFSLYIGYIIYIILHYIPGALWYCYFTTKELTLQGLFASSLVTVVPFIIPDCIKMLLASLTVKRLKKIIKAV